MCGYSGILFFTDSVQNNFNHKLSSFRNASRRIAHRGDQKRSEYLSDTIWLSHYRLAFQDLESGKQPMLSHDEKHVIIFNGEVYNHLELRSAICNKTRLNFKTRSDTETIIEGWKAFGSSFFEKLEGEYSFIILDVKGTELVAHRDRFGVKPLFLYADGIDTRKFSSYANEYNLQTNYLEFSSEIKGLTSSKTWCREGLLRQFTGLYEPICTPFKNVFQIPSGGFFQAKKNKNGFDCTLITTKAPIRASNKNKYSAAENTFANTFSSSVEDRLLSDVELGVYLSSGIDSKAVAYELGRLKSHQHPMKSFTVGFQESAYDETDEAVRFAKHVGLQPHVLIIDSNALNYSYPLAVQNSELIQPYTNGAAKWWLSLFARQYVKGVLTGDGADEILCGYPSYRYASWWKFIMRARGQAKTASDVLNLIQKNPLGSIDRDRLYLLKFSAHSNNPWLAGSSAAGTGQDFVDSIRIMGLPHPLFGQIKIITETLLGKTNAEEWLEEQAESVQSWFSAGFDNINLCDPQNTLLVWQNYFAKTHLPTLILNWVGDRMEMANTLEGRTPFLSDKMRQLVYKQPDNALISGLRDKVLLRRAYSKVFGQKFANIPKKQFNAPFLDSEKLIKEYKAESIFSDTGISEELTLTSLLRKADLLEKDSPYYATHLRAVHQTAISLSIVNKTIVMNEEIIRDTEFEEKYISSGGVI